MMRTVHRSYSIVLLTAVLSTAAPILFLPATAIAQAKPKGATAQCEDHTYSTAKSPQGACSGHGGVANWLGDSTERSQPATRPNSKASAPKEAGTRQTTNPTTVTHRPR